MNPDFTAIAISLLKSIRYMPVLFVCAHITIVLPADSINLDKLPGWQLDNPGQAWGSWQNSCQAFKKKQVTPWTTLCKQSLLIDSNNPEAIRQFFVSRFIAQPLINPDGSSEGVITGYYEPVLSGSLQADDKYRYPVYAKPADPALLGLTRQQIDSMPEKLQSEIILWTDNPYDLFFLHVQGSGRVQLDNGKQMSLVYAGNNGHEYTSIGKLLIERGEMERDKISMQTLKQWLVEHPQKASEVMQQNNRFIFFKLTETPAGESGPRGSLNVPLTPGRSIAIDPAQIPPGSPLWLDTTLPVQSGDANVFQRLVFAQDTGAAIKGRVRADVFFGQGENAEYLAGHMNQAGKLYLLVPAL